MLNNIVSYKEAFSNLHVKIVDERKFPNKAILLISVMNLVRCGYITDNRIRLDNTIGVAFDYYWRMFINSTSPIVWTPFWHMKNERFWHFQPIYTLADIDEIVKPGETASLGKMKKVIKYAYLDNELFNIIQEPYGRTELFTVLKQFLY